MKNKLFLTIAIALFGWSAIAQTKIYNNSKTYLSTHKKLKSLNDKRQLQNITQENVFENNITNLLKKSYDCLFDSEYVYKGDTVNNVWNLTSKNKYSVGTNGYIASILTQTWNNSTWLNDGLQTSSYDINDNLTSELIQTWSGNAWWNDRLFTYTINTNNLPISILEQSWNGNAWVNIGLYTYTYDTNNNMINELDQIWNGSAWVNDYQFLYTYDTNNYITSESQLFWTGNMWETIALFTYTYDLNNNLINVLSQLWFNNNWENVGLSTFTYNTNNNLTSMLYQSWNDSTFVNFLLDNFTYCSNNCPHTTSSYFWHNNQLEKSDSTDNFCSYSSGISETVGKELQNAEIFPNPNNGIFTVSSNIEQYQIIITNLLGEIIYSSQINSIATGNNEIVINLNNSAKGIYFYQFLNKQKLLQTGKFIIE